MPPRRNQLPLSTAIIPSLQMFLYSQGSVIQLIFKKVKAIEIKLAVVKRILFMVKCSITEQILAGPPLSHFSCYAPTSQLKPLLTPQQHVYYQQCNHHNRKSMTTKLEGKQDSRKQSWYWNFCSETASRTGLHLVCIYNKKCTPFPQLDNSSLFSRSTV